MSKIYDTACSVCCFPALSPSEVLPFLFICRTQGRPVRKVEKRHQFRCASLSWDTFCQTYGKSGCFFPWAAFRGIIVQGNELRRSVFTMIFTVRKQKVSRFICFLHLSNYLSYSTYPIWYPEYSFRRTPLQRICYGIIPVVPLILPIAHWADPNNGVETQPSGKQRPY